MGAEAPAAGPPPVRRGRHDTLWKGLTLALVAATGVLLTGRIDLDPPQLAVTPLDARTAGPVVLRGQVADGRPGVGGLSLVVDGGAATAVALEADGSFALPLALAHGDHQLELVAVDASWLANTTTWAAPLVVDAEGPAADLAFVPPEPAAGAPIWAVATARPPAAGPSDMAAATLSLGGRDWPMLPAGEGRWQALVALPLDHPGGPVPATLVATDDLGNAAEQRRELSVVAQDWPRGGAIRLTAAQRAAREDDAALRAMHAARAAAMAATRPGPVPTVVQQPTTGWISSPFGRFRTYSDGARQHHLGLDIANTTGSPVRAMAAGEVTLADTLPIHGRTVIVDHGWGLSSSYSHLSAVEVEPGDALAAGQQLGRVGSTGQSTGPHLHWEVAVGGVPVDPRHWLEPGVGAP